ncbi:hypothetical protein GF339_22125 [candidate division KSB3 bacterium]|uniref:Polymerase/histidinol phosphatase N-terminal domain-containing protein n=1 Tax=candidate division KSB3 bacterium TaxID=2044937 RepID=A0A9D5Q7V7_9BACT|nr:hypothetical protein [candidate division KSB3 bacterium]MBD3327300.1 hypothetical protein [candidate division KSB3 bacterium]
MKVDLHIHSYLSDGKYSPSQIVAYSVQRHLDVIALTDHDTIAGLREARETLRQYPISFVPGVEFSTSISEDELHILGYGIDETYPAMIEFLARAQASRRKRVCRILHRLEQAGIRIGLEELRNGASPVSVGRMHIARLLLKRGHVRTIREAFERYLSYKTKFVERSPADFISSQKAIELIRAAGGIAVFAHPTIALFDRYIDPLIEAGLQGVEVFKGTRPSIEEFYLETVVQDKGLLLTGGSDWHGYHYSCALGNFYVDSEQIQPFLNAMQIC